MSLNNATITKGMSRAMTLLFAIAGGIAVGNLYWAQPLLSTISESLGISLAESGTLITVTQLGYAAGVLLLLPLGDTANRRKFIPIMLTGSAIALLGSSFAPSYLALIFGLALVGITSLSGQLLLPLAGDIAKEEQRGQVIGTIASGMLIGIMLSRFMAGIMADTFGWRSIYLAAGVVNFMLALSLYKYIPSEQNRPSIAYMGLLASIPATVKRFRSVQITLILGACAFCVFTMFWTGLTFFLSNDPFNFSITQIGLVNLIGLVGAFAAKNAGKLHDRGYTTGATGAMFVLAMIALGTSALGNTSIALVLLSILLINLAIQSIMVLNQTRLLTIQPELRSRLNTAFIVCNFIAGAAGSAIAGYLWQSGGWLLLVAGQAVIILIGLLVWATQRGVLNSASQTSN